MRVPSHLLPLLAGVGLVWALLQNTEQGPHMQVLDLGSWALCWEEGCTGQSPAGWDLRALAGNPMNAFLICSFSYILSFTPPSRPLPPLIHSCFQERLHCIDRTQICVFPSDTVLGKLSICDMSLFFQLVQRWHVNKLGSPSPCSSARSHVLC